MSAGIDFTPDWVSPPGDTISDILVERRMSASDFAVRMECEANEIDGLIGGRIELTIEIALRLEKLLGASSEFWLKREANYRRGLSTRQSNAPTEADLAWVSEFPYADMAKLGWVKPSRSPRDRFIACLDFFDVSSVKEWRTGMAAVGATAFRTSTSFSSSSGAIAAWLRQGEIESKSMACAPWDAAAFRSVLSEIRGLTRKKQPDAFLPKLQEICAACGVAVTVVRAPKGCRASGATRFLSEDKAQLQLSFRYLSEDHFWFTFFHEAGHLVLHGTDGTFIEGDGRLETQQEQEANDFAARLLVPLEYEDELTELGSSHLDIMRFAKRLGISAGIVVGQLQHRGILPRDHMNDLKRRYRWT